MSDGLAAEFTEFRRTRDTALRDRLVESHVELAYWVAQQFSGRGEELEDLRQIALLALVKAVERFDPGFGVTFSTFATPTITGELKRHFRDRRWAVRPPRAIQERSLELTTLVETLTHELHRSPTVEEIGRAGRFTPEQVLEAMEASSAYTRDHHDLADLGELSAHLAENDSRLDNVDDFATIEPLLRTLPDREREIVILRYFGGQTQQTIARRVGVSQMHVSRLLARSLSRLRAGLDAEGMPTAS